MLETLENKGDVINYETRDYRTPQRGKKYII